MTSSMASIPIETVRDQKPSLSDTDTIEIGLETLRAMADESYAKYLASNQKDTDMTMCIHRLLHAIDASIKFMSRVVAQ